jgi:hypothetical protein
MPPKTIRTTGKLAPGLKFTRPGADAIHEAQRNARPNHAKTIRHLTAWSDEIARRNERLVAALKQVAPHVGVIYANKPGEASKAREAVEALLVDLGEIR